MTLQQHFNLIKEGKGNKDQFLKQARSLFPQYFNQYTDFNTATNVLKSKQILSEAAGGVVSKGYSAYDWKKILGEEVKAMEKETSKEVLDYRKNAYDNVDMKNADNVNFNEIMKGFFAEMYEAKNQGKTGDEIKAMVVKNLAKDPLYYTKNGNFSTMGVGYTEEAPGLGEPKEPKGKFKSSGYGDIEKEVKVKANVKDSLGDSEAKDSMPKKVKEMPDKGVSGIEKRIKLKENKETSDEKIARYEGYTYTLDGKEVKPEIAFYNNILKAELDGEIYRIDEPVNGKVELNPIKGKTGMYTESTINESFFLDLDDAKEEAQRISKEEGVVQHVNIDGEGYNVEDWYDSDNTVASYENGYSLNEVVYQGPSVGGPSMPGEKGRRFIPNVTVLSREAVDAINDRGRTRVNWNKPHIKIVKSGENIKLQVSQPLLDVISGSQRGNFAGSSLQSKMGTGLTSEDTKMLSGEFKKLLRTLNAASKLSKTGDYYLVDVDTVYNPKRDQFELPLPKAIQEISDIDLSQYNSMSDREIIRWAKDDGMEDMIVMDPEGGLVNREEILLALLGTEGMGDEEKMKLQENYDSKAGLGKKEQDKISTLSKEEKKALYNDLTDAIGDVNDQDFKDKASYAKAMKDAKIKVYKKHNILSEIQDPNKLEEGFNLSQYDNMSDKDIINWAKEDGMEDFIEYNEVGELNREELLSYLLGKEVGSEDLGDFDYDTRDKEADHDSNLDEPIEESPMDLRTPEEKKLSKLFDKKPEDLKKKYQDQQKDPNKSLFPKKESINSSLGESKLRSLIRNIIKEELNEGSLDINGKTVRTYTQNGDKSYNVTYDDGTKDRIAVSNDAWDKINTLRMNATNEESNNESDLDVRLKNYIENEVPTGDWKSTKNHFLKITQDKPDPKRRYFELVDGILKKYGY